MFASNVGTAAAYFGSQTSGSDVITAKNMTTTWGTSTLTLAPGTASQVLITLSPTNPTLHTTTNVTVSLQLQDQFGNAVPLAGVGFTLRQFRYRTLSNTTNNAGTPTITLSGTGAGGATNAAGVATAAFGDDTTQTVTITATGTGTYLESRLPRRRSTTEIDEVRLRLHATEFLVYVFVSSTRRRRLVETRS